jgi:serine/threonine protein kinase
MGAKSGDTARGSRTLLGFPTAPDEADAPRAGGPLAGSWHANERTLLGVTDAPAEVVPRSATNVAALEPGAIVEGRYVLGHPLVEGGMATIWAATDRATGRAVIVKSVHVRLSDNVEVLRRFEQEADIIAAVRSPHVVELLDRGVLAGAPYLVLERLEGEDLEVRLGQRRLSVAECTTLLDQVALALVPAHRAGVVHRDLKPANIFLARTAAGEVVKLLDFGIAKLREGSLHLTVAGQTVGSPEYMSPEQIQGRSDLDGRSDLFALASVLYTCLTGKAPFTGPTIAHTMERTMAGDLVPPSKAAPDVPRRLDAFFTRALAFERDERYPDAAAMAHAFRLFADEDRPSVSVDVEPTPPPVEVTEQPRARPAEPPPPPPPRLEAPVVASPPAARSGSRSRGVMVVGTALVALLVAAAVTAAMWPNADQRRDSRERPSRSRTDVVPAR